MKLRLGPTTTAIVLFSGLISGAVAQDEQPINLPDEMYKSIAQGASVARVLKWLADGGNPNIVIDTDANTLVHHAATNLLHILRAVVHNGGGCRRNEHGASPLHFAATQEPLGPGPDSIRLLAWCDANEQDNRGNTPLHTVYEGVEKLAPVVIPNLGLTLLPDSGGGGRIDIAKVLLAEADADPNIRNRNGDAPIMMVVRRGGGGIFDQTGHLKLLLAHGADPNTRNGEGETPLLAAVALGPSRTWYTETRDAIKLLLAGGADPNLRARNGDTPLIRTARHDEDTVIDIEALLQGGADPCLRDARGYVAYDYTDKDSEGGRLLYKVGGYIDDETDTCARDLADAEVAENEIGLDKAQRKKLQACLKTQGFDAGTPDGIFGRNTRATIRAWQAAQGRTGSEALGFLSAADVEALTTRCYVARSPECTGNPSDTPNGCWMKVEGGADCHVWNPYPKPEETVTWNGQCVDGLISGKGRDTWRFREDGEMRMSWYEGEYREGKLQDGALRSRSSEGTVQVGTLKDGRWHGHVTETYSDGAVWEGPYVKGKAHGLWVKHASGELVAQCWQDDEREDLEACGRVAVDRRMQAKARVSLRRGPGDEYSEVARLAAEDAVQVMAEFGEWLWVVVDDGSASGFVRNSSFVDAVKIITEPKCLTGLEVYKERFLDWFDDFTVDWNEFRWRARQTHIEHMKREAPDLLNRDTIVGLEEYQEKTGFVLEMCWKEIVNRPGCHIFVGPYFPHWGPGKGDVYLNHSHGFYTRYVSDWTGKCEHGVVEGTGEVIWWTPGLSGPSRREGTYRHGKRHGEVHQSDKNNLSDSDCVDEGRYEGGLRVGDWVRHSCSHLTEENGSVTFVDGFPVKCTDAFRDYNYGYRQEEWYKEVYGEYGCKGTIGPRHD